MKKFEVRMLLALLLVATLVLALVACGGGGKDTLPPETQGNDPTLTEPPVTDPAETDPVETDPVETDPAETDPAETDGGEETDPPKYDPIETDPPVTEAPHEHSYEKTATVAATCQADGYTEYTCKECGDTKKDDVIAKVDHFYMTEIVSYRSCTVDGETADVCIYCGDMINVEVDPAQGCSPYKQEGDIVSHTHHTGIISKCSLCGTVYSIEPTVEHVLYAKVRVEDTLTDSGDIQYGHEVLACDCGYERVVYSNHASGHCYYLEEGSGRYVCACGDMLKDGEYVYNGNENAGADILPEN